MPEGPETKRMVDAISKSLVGKKLSVIDFSMKSYFILIAKVN